MTAESASAAKGGVRDAPSMRSVEYLLAGATAISG